MKTFRDRVLGVVAKIPRGETLTYAEVAEYAGSPKAHRAVGSILKQNYDSSIPCHRVIRSNGAIGKYNRGEERKRILLQEEKVV